jgi:hypothetical protein
MDPEHRYLSPGTACRELTCGKTRDQSCPRLLRQAGPTIGAIFSSDAWYIAGVSNRWLHEEILREVAAPAHQTLKHRSPESHELETSSQLRGVPRSISWAARLPRTSFRCRVCSPLPGRMERTFTGVNASPRCIG